MRILFLTQIVPYPPDAGPKVKTWHVIRFLSNQGHKVILATFVRPEEEQHVPVLEKLCDQVYTVPIKRSRIEDIGYLVRSFVSGRPFLVERDDLVEMRNLVEDLVNNQEIDVIHADQLTMSQFAFLNQEDRKNKGVGNNHGMEQGATPLRIFDAHNAVWTILERMTENVAWYLRPFARYESRKIKQYEGQIVKEFDHTFAVTEIDKSALLSAVNSENNVRSPVENSISVVPIAVDTGQIQAVKLQAGSSSILTLGTLHYPPNADGIRWFFEQVFPKIREKNPDAKLTIIGKNPPADFIRYAEQNPAHVNVTGYVQDLEPYFREAAVLVIPVRAGGGMRVRILEGLAYGEAIVTTTVGLEGIEAESGEDIIVADSAQDFAEAVLQLLEDFEKRSELAKNGRKLVERKYDWQVVLREVNHIYSQFERNYRGVPANGE